MQEDGCETVNSDWECFFRARDGDSPAWHEILERHQSRLAALALLMTGSAAASDDIVQETFLRAFKSRIHHRQGSVRGFLTTIAYRLALKETQHEKRKVELDSGSIEDRNCDPLERLLSSERDRHIAKAIRSLDNDHRDVLTLRFYGDHSYDDIAKLMNIPIGTVKSRMFYAVKRCREHLREKGIIE